MIYLILYDITNDQIRQKVSRRLVAEGYERIQLSVFAGLNNPKLSSILWADISKWLGKEKTAKLYVIKVSRSSFREMATIGELEWDPEFLLGEKTSLFF